MSTTNWRQLPRVAICLIGMFLPVAASAAEVGDEILPLLLSHDLEFVQTTIELDCVVAPLERHGNPVKIRRRVVSTYDGRRFASQEVFQEVDSGKIENWNERYMMNLSHFALSDPSNAVSVVEGAMELDADGRPILLGRTADIRSHFKPGGADLYYSSAMARWACGFGFSEYLTELKLTKIDDDGMWRATGKHAVVTGFEVRLVIDPKTLVVREATFVSPRGRESLKVTTSGSERIGDITLAKRATVSMLRRTSQYEMRSIKIEFDKAVFESVRKRIEESTASGFTDIWHS